LLAGLDDNIKLLWQWHFMEEIEHRAIAFDIFQHCGGNYIQRSIGYFLAAFFLLIGFSSYFLHMICYDKLYLSKSFYREAYQFFFGKIGILRVLFIGYLRYLLPRFHPNQNTYFHSFAARTSLLQLIDKQLKDKYD